MTEQQLREQVVKIAYSFYGYNEVDGSHKDILAVYNDHKPLARSYKVKPTDAWCATFVSAVFIRAGLTDIAPTECSCPKMIELYKKKGRWVENDNHKPQPGDVIMYDWQDSGAGDNTGNPDHVGIVYSVSGTTLKIIEGNISNRVDFRTLQVGGKYIRGYCTPDYSAAAGTAKPKPTTPAQEEKPVSAPQSLLAGDVVELKAAAKQYYPGGPTIPAWVKNYEHLVTQATNSGKAVYKGGKQCVLLGKKRVKGQKSTQAGISTWVAVDNLVFIEAVDSTYELYTVKTGDTLWGIAASKLGAGSRYPEIKRLNNLTSEVIRKGQQLKLPK